MTRSYTAFSGWQKIASGTAAEVAIAVKRASNESPRDTVMIFEDETGKAVDFDLRGTDAEIAARLEPVPEAPRSRGRPKLGVVSKEVTLLPRHWDWLGRQRGGVSATLRRLVDSARKEGGGRDRIDAAYRFMSAMAGNLPGFEEAARALYAGDWIRFGREMVGWPDDVRGHASALAFGQADEAAA